MGGVGTSVTWVGLQGVKETLVPLHPKGLYTDPLVIPSDHWLCPLRRSTTVTAFLPEELLSAREGIKVRFAVEQVWPQALRFLSKTHL